MNLVDDAADLPADSPAWWANGWLACVLAGDLATAWAFTDEALRDTLAADWPIPDVGDEDFAVPTLKALRRLVGEPGKRAHIFTVTRDDESDRSLVVMVPAPTDGVRVAPAKTGLGFDLVRAGEAEWHVAAVRPDCQVPTRALTITLPDGWLN